MSANEALQIEVWEDESGVHFRDGDIQFVCSVSFFAKDVIKQHRGETVLEFINRCVMSNGKPDVRIDDPLLFRELDSRFPPWVFPAALWITSMLGFILGRVI